MTQNTTAELLEGAADYIEKNGLHKGWYFKGFSPDDDFRMTEDVVAELRAEGKTPPCCALGAIAMTAAQLRLGTVWFDSNLHAAMKGAGVPWAEIPDWNDKPSQRKSRVVATLRKAADFARKESK